MTAGELNKRIRFEKRQTVADDGYGNERTQWQAFLSVWARITPLRGKEKTQGDAPTSLVTHKIKVRKSNAISNVTPDCRIVNNRTDEIYGIEMIVNRDEHGRYLEIQAVAGQIE